MTVSTTDWLSIGDVAGVRALTVADVTSDATNATVNACSARSEIVTETVRGKAVESAICGRLGGLFGGRHGVARGTCLCCAAHGDQDETTNPYLKSLALRTAFALACPPADPDGVRVALEDDAVTAALSPAPTMGGTKSSQQQVSGEAVAEPDATAFLVASANAVASLLDGAAAEALVNTACVQGRISAEAATNVIDVVNPPAAGGDNVSAQ
jgi:hypothetical protein